MSAHVYRGAGGAWMARIELERGDPSNRGVGAVWARLALPVPASAAKDEAERALRALMRRKEACRHGRR